MRFLIIPVFEASSLELLVGSSNKLKLLQDSAVSILTVGQIGVCCSKMNKCSIG